MNDLPYPDEILPRLRYQYCPMCATPLTRRAINDDGIPRVVCPACGWVHYPTQVTGVCTVVKHHGEIVAILPADSPADMPAALPAGHCEYGESPEQAAAREAQEETGLIVEIEGCLGWRFDRRADYSGPNVTFFFEAHSTGGELRGSEEGQVATFPIERFPPISPARRGSFHAMQLYRERLAKGQGG